MSALVAGSITYTLDSLPTVNNFSMKSVTAKLVFGDGALTYPSGGVPITGSSLGLPNVISRLDVFDAGTSGYVFSYDSTNATLRIFQRDAHGHSLFLKNAAVADGAGARVNAAASNLLGANTGTSITVAASDGSTTGGVVTATGAALSELGTTVAPATITIKVQASGY